MSGRELPAGWIEAELGDIADIKSGITLGKKRSPDQELIERPYLRVANVQRGSLDLSTIKTVAVTPEEAEALKLEEGDILMNEGGDRDKLGRGWVWTGEIPNCIHQNHVFRVRLRDRRVQSKYVSLYANEIGRHYFERQGKQSVNLASINQTMVAKLPVPVPPLPEQHRIVEKIEALTARSRRAREALDALPALIDRYRQSILAAAFRGDLTAEWRSSRADVDGAITLDAIREAFRNRQNKVVAPKPDWECPEDVPAGWAYERLELLCDPSRGIPYGIVQTGEPFTGGVPTVRCGDIKDYRINLERLKRVDPSVAAEYSRTRLRGGEVLIAIRGTVGATAVAGPEMAGMNISREVAMLPVLPGLDARYLCYLMTSPQGAAHLMRQVKGVAQTGINLSDLRDFPVLLPHIDEQLAIAEILDAALARLRSLNELVTEKTDRLSTLDQSILTKAFRGELVPQDPNDEPASVLLERILAERAGAGEKPRRGRPRKAG